MIGKFFRRNGLMMFLVLFAVGIVGLFFFSKPKEKVKGVPLEKKWAVQDLIRYEVLPVYDKKTSTVYILSLIESFQNEAEVSINLKDTTLLEDELGNVSKPSYWVQTQKKEFSQKGWMKFSLAKQHGSKIFFHIYGAEDLDFEWTLPE